MSIHSEISSQPAWVFHPERLPSKNRGGGARTIPLVTAARGATTYLNGITIFEPGAQIAHHVHNVAESVMVIAGRAIVDIDGERVELEAFDTTFVPANIPHHFENTSDVDEMRIFWTYGSLDATRTIVETGQHGRVDGEGGAGLTGETPRIVQHVATLMVRPGHEQTFEAAVTEAAVGLQRENGVRALSVDRSEDRLGAYRVTIARATDLSDDTTAGDPLAGLIELVADHLAAEPSQERMTHVLTAF